MPMPGWSRADTRSFGWLRTPSRRPGWRAFSVEPRRRANPTWFAAHLAHVTLPQRPKRQPRLRHLGTEGRSPAAAARIGPARYDPPWQASISISLEARWSTQSPPMAATPPIAGADRRTIACRRSRGEGATGRAGREEAGSTGDDVGGEPAARRPGAASGTRSGGAGACRRGGASRVRSSRAGTTTNARLMTITAMANTMTASTTILLRRAVAG